MPQLPDVPLKGLYGDAILDHYRRPRNRKLVPQPDIKAEEFNPFCGDRVILQLQLDSGGKVVDVGAQAEGCSIIQAAASMMSEALKGKSLKELDGLAREFREFMRSKSFPQAPQALGALEALTVVRQFPVRIKCALLPWTALEVGIEAYRSNQTRDQ